MMLCRYEPSLRAIDIILLPPFSPRSYAIAIYADAAIIDAFCRYYAAATPCCRLPHMPYTRASYFAAIAY